MQPADCEDATVFLQLIPTQAYMRENHYCQRIVQLAECDDVTIPGSILFESRGALKESESSV